MMTVRIEFFGPDYSITALKFCFDKLKSEHCLNLRQFLSKKNTFFRRHHIGVLKSPFIHKKSHETFCNKAESRMLVVEMSERDYSVFTQVLALKSCPRLLPYFLFGYLNKSFSFFYVIRKCISREVVWNYPVIY